VERFAEPGRRRIFGAGKSLQDGFKPVPGREIIEPEGCSAESVSCFPSPKGSSITTTGRHHKKPKPSPLQELPTGHSRASNLLVDAKEHNWLQMLHRKQKFKERKQVQHQLNFTRNAL
jgi:hypothetical protein